MRLANRLRELPPSVKAVVSCIIPYGIIKIIVKRVLQAHQRKIELIMKEWNSTDQHTLSWKNSRITREEIIALVASWGLDESTCGPWIYLVIEDCIVLIANNLFHSFIKLQFHIIPKWKTKRRRNLLKKQLPTSPSG